MKWNAVLLALLLLVGSVRSASALSGGLIQRVSVASDGTEDNGPSQSSCI